VRVLFGGHAHCHDLICSVFNKPAIMFNTVRPMFIYINNFDFICEINQEMEKL